MKKLTLFITLILITINTNAQVYSKCITYDKFDDVITESNSKTLVTITDTTVVFETKGYNPVTYRIIARSNKGTNSDIQNLINDIYGYEEYYHVVNDHDWNTVKRIETTALLIGDQEYYLKEMGKYVLTIVNRTITTRYTGTWISSIIMITDPSGNGSIGKNISKQVYYDK